MGQKNEKRGSKRGGERMVSETVKSKRKKTKPEMALYDLNKNNKSGFLNLCEDDCLCLLKPIRLNLLYTDFIAN